MQSRVSREGGRGSRSGGSEESRPREFETRQLGVELRWLRIKDRSIEELRRES